MCFNKDHVIQEMGRLNHSIAGAIRFRNNTKTVYKIVQ